MRHHTRLALALGAALMIAATPVLPAMAQDTLALGLGYYDINDDEGAADFRAEYRWDDPLIWQVKPWAGAEATSDGAVYAAGGVLLDMEIGGTDGAWVVTPSFGAGLYGDGDGKDLGHVIEFRSQLEIGYRFSDSSRLTLAGGHISNAGIGDSNPGTEILNVYYHIPVGSIFGGGSKSASSYDYNNSGDRYAAAPVTNGYDYNETAPAAGTPIVASPIDSGPYNASDYAAAPYNNGYTSTTTPSPQTANAGYDTGAYGSAYGTSGY